MNNKIVIIMDGGLIHEVIANGPVEVLTVDHDIEGAGREHIHLIPQGDCPPAWRYVRFEEVIPDASRVATLWKIASHPA